MAIEWRDPIPEFFFHCDLSGYKETVQRSGGSPPCRGVWRSGRVHERQDEDAEQTVPVVKPGTKAMGLKVSGAQTRGRSSADRRPQRRAARRAGAVGPPGPVRRRRSPRTPVGTIISYRPRNATYIALTNPAPGTWRIVPLLGTAPITSVAQSTVLPQPQITAKVGGRGRSRILRYRQAAHPGEKVTFVERAKGLEHALPRVRGRTGTLRFAPGGGRPGRRQIVANVTQDGLPRKSYVVASYVAPRPSKPGRAGRVRLRRSGSSAVTVTWRPAARAARYVVKVRLADGHRSTTIVPARSRRSVRVAAFLPKKGGQVRITAVDRAGLAGPVVTAKLKASR